MSDAPEGPGWWLASDGRYYPPQARPAPQPVAPAPVAPSPAQPSQWGAPAPAAPSTWGASPNVPPSLPSSGESRSGPFTLGGVLAIFAVLVAAGVVAAFYFLEVQPAGPDARFTAAPVWLAGSVLALLAILAAAKGGGLFELDGCLAYLVYGIPMVWATPAARRWAVSLWGGGMLGLTVCLTIGWAS